MKDKDITELAKHFAASPVRLLPRRGRPEARRAQIPRLASQREDYLVETMRAYRDGKRTGADTTMSEVLYGLGDADIKARGHSHFLARRE